MFFKPALIATTAFAALAVAGPTPSGQCSTGSQYCCNTVESSDSPAALAALGLVGAVLTTVVDVGLTCTPVTVLGAVLGSTCSQQPVCCTGNNFSGLVVVGCSPVNL